MGLLKGACIGFIGTLAIHTYKYNVHVARTLLAYIFNDITTFGQCNRAFILFLCIVTEIGTIAMHN